MARLHTHAPATRWLDVFTRSGDAFAIEVKMPTFDDRLLDEGFALARVMDDEPAAEMARRRQLAFRLGFVVGWRDVEDADGLPVEFSIEAFQNVCVCNPDVMHVVALRLSTFFATTTRIETDAEKKLQSPSVPSGDQTGHAADTPQ